MDNLFVEIVAPNRRAFQGQAQGLRAPGAEGSFEVLKDHAPMIATIEVGPIFVTSLTGEKIGFATSGGFVEVLNNVVTVLTETCEPASEIDVERAQDAEQRAKEALTAAAGPEEREKAEKALERARNRLRLSMGDV